MITTTDVIKMSLGASIACNGICLTVTQAEQGRFQVEASAETASRTTLGDWHHGTKVNLERALKLGEELGGHLVSGHVDGIATLSEIVPEGGSQRMRFELNRNLGRFVAVKGSIALDGVSLTVNEVQDYKEITWVTVNIIRYTAAETNFGWHRQGSRVNVEIDMLARYLERLTQQKTG
ncbi:MAG: riboflavin synthase [Alphaproteobacteria bacterium]